MDRRCLVTPKNAFVSLMAGSRAYALRERTDKRLLATVLTALRGERQRREEQTEDVDSHYVAQRLEIVEACAAWDYGRRLQDSARVSMQYLPWYTEYRRYPSAFRERVSSGISAASLGHNIVM
ncbi:hypothetical protein KIPB_010256, partial [Kipferlia bialata]|eukprot:g10256.t1